MKESCILISVFVITGWVQNVVAGKGENAYYWWDDSRATAWTGGSGWFTQPQKLPWMLPSWSSGQTRIRYGVPGIGALADNPQPAGFVRWIELCGQQTANNNQHPYVGYICGQDDYTKIGVPLKFGGKSPSGDEIIEDLYFYFAEMEPLPTTIDISTNGWVAFKSGGAVLSEGKLPDTTKPNATIAAFWQNFVADEMSYTPGANDDTVAVPAGVPGAGRKVWSDSGVVFYGLRTYEFAYSGGTAIVPVFIIEWFNCRMASGAGRYTFQLQLINPIIGDENWARFLGRWGRLGKDPTEMDNFASLRGQVLIPEFIVVLFNYRSPGADPWWNYEREDIDLVGVEDENGLRGIAAEVLPALQPYDDGSYNWTDADCGIIFDYWKWIHEELGVFITNPPHNIVLRWTEIQPKIWVTNYGGSATPADGAPISLHIYKGTEKIHDDRVDVYLPGVGLDRNKEPNFANGAIKEVTFPKLWKPEEVGTVYRMRAEVCWDLDTASIGNNFDEKYITVGCEDTIGYHEGTVTDYCHLFGFGNDWTIDPEPFPEHYATYFANAGGPIHSGSPYPDYGHAWIKALRTNIGDYGWSLFSSEIFSVTAVADQDTWKPLPDIGTGFETGNTNWSPLQATGSYNQDGWWGGYCDNTDATSSTQGWNVANKFIGTIHYTDDFNLGLEVDKPWWIDTYAMSCPGANSRQSVGMGVSFSGPVTPLGWQLLIPEDSTRTNPAACTPQCGAALPISGTSCVWGNMNWYIPINHFLAKDWGEEPVNFAQDAIIHTGIHDITAYLAKKLTPATDGNYYFEDNKELSSEIMIANIGEVNETNTPGHPMEAIVRVEDAKEDSVWQDFVAITSLNVGDSFDAVLPKWPSTGDAGCCYFDDPDYPCDKEYTLYLISSLRYPGLNSADHCPYNDTIKIPFKVLWTYDIAYTGGTVEPWKDKYNPGDVISLKAKFRNLGINDTVNIPVRCEITDANTGEELYSVNRTIARLNWRGSSAGPPNEVEVDFGTWTVPAGFDGYLDFKFRIAEGFNDECDKNDYGAPVGIAEEKPVLPGVFELSTIRPNPFLSFTEIRYALPKPTDVSLKIYDSSGKLIKTLVNAHQSARFYTISWDGTDNLGRKVGQGLYFIRMETPEFKTTKKLVLLTK